MNNLKCENCCYYWQEDYEKYPHCQYPQDDPYPAPCEEEEYWNED